MTAQTIRLWMGQHGPAVMMVAEAFASPSVAAEDIFQETFVLAWKEGRRASIHHPRAWLLKVALNIGRNVRRAETRSRVALAERMTPPSPAPPLDIPQELQRRAAWNAVKALPERQRRVLLLRLVSDLSMDDIATRLGITAGTARATFRDAKRTLQKLIPTHDEPDSLPLKAEAGGR